jgi:hypothetical protein
MYYHNEKCQTSDETHAAYYQKKNQAADKDTKIMQNKAARSFKRLL